MNKLNNEIAGTKEPAKAVQSKRYDEAFKKQVGMKRLRGRP